MVYFFIHKCCIRYHWIKCKTVMILGRQMKAMQVGEHGISKPDLPKTGQMISPYQG